MRCEDREEGRKVQESKSRKDCEFKSLFDSLTFRLFDHPDVRRLATPHPAGYDLMFTSMLGTLACGM